MYEEKGLLRVYNGHKYKIVSYLRDGNEVIFTTSSKSKKYNELKKSNNYMKAMLKGEALEYRVEVIEEREAVDRLFMKLKAKKAIPFFIPRKDKIIVRYKIKEDF